MKDTAGVIINDETIAISFPLYKLGLIFNKAKTSKPKNKLSREKQESSIYDFKKWYNRKRGVKNGPTLLSTSRPNLPPDHVLIDIIGHY